MRIYVQWQSPSSCCVLVLRRSHVKGFDNGNTLGEIGKDCGFGYMKKVHTSCLVFRQDHKPSQTRYQALCVNITRNLIMLQWP